MAEGAGSHGGSLSRARGTQQIVAARHGDASGARHFQHAEWTQNLQQAVDLVHRAGNFHDQGFGGHVHHARAKHLDEFHQVGAVLLVGGNFDQRQVALQHGTVGNIFGQQDIHELFQAGFQPVGAALIRVRAKSHAGNRFVFGGADGERINVDGQAPGEGSDPVQYPRLVFDISNDGLHAILDFLNPASAPDQAGSGAISPDMISFYRERVQRGTTFPNTKS